VVHLSNDALNVSGDFIGGAWVEEMAAKTCELAWVSPRRAGGTVKVRFSFKRHPFPPIHQADPPQPPQKR
jgi:hypothetical protein